MAMAGKKETWGNAVRADGLRGEVHWGGHHLHLPRHAHGDPGAFQEWWAGVRLSCGHRRREMPPGTQGDRGQACSIWSSCHLEKRGQHSLFAFAIMDDLKCPEKDGRGVASPCSGTASNCHGSYGEEKRLRRSFNTAICRRGTLCKVRPGFMVSFVIKIISNTGGTSEPVTLYHIFQARGPYLASCFMITWPPRSRLKSGLTTSTLATIVLSGGAAGSKILW